MIKEKKTKVEKNYLSMSKGELLIEIKKLSSKVLVNEIDYFTTRNFLFTY